MSPKRTERCIQKGKYYKLRLIVVTKSETFTLTIIWKFGTCLKIDHHYTPFQTVSEFFQQYKHIDRNFLIFIIISQIFFFLCIKMLHERTRGSTSGESRVKSIASFNDFLEVRTDFGIHNTPIWEKFMWRKTIMCEEPVQTSNWESSTRPSTFLFLDTRSFSALLSLIRHRLMVQSQEPEQT